ncbi:UNVERIFIED_ORG: serine/threonine-protein kinase/serine/threonine-protein kinase PknK [Gordonia westfalica J30]
MAAHITAERLRSGIGASALTVESFPAAMPHDLSDGIVQVTAEKTEEAAIRALLAVGDDDAHHEACRRARALTASIDEQARPRAALNAQLLLTECVAANGANAEAEELLLPILDRCARLGLVQPVLDAGYAVRQLVRRLGTTGRGEVDPAVVPFLDRLSSTPRAE